jgi:type IV secretion system protein VirB1
MLRNIVLGNTSFRREKFWMNLAFLGCWSLIISFPSDAQQQRAGAWLSEAEFVSIAARCAPGAPPDTLFAIARTESGLHPNAISINRPRSSAKDAGYRDAEIILSRQPQNKMEAARWIRWLAAHHLTVSIGLMQVNVEMASRFSVSGEQLLDPCTNLRVGAAILIAAYSDLARDMGEGFAALDAALSFYNTGNSIAGFRNGYVANVYAHAPRRSALFSP